MRRNKGRNPTGRSKTEPSSRVTRREFLGGVGTVAFSAALASLPQRADALYNMGAFWKKKAAGAGSSGSSDAVWGTGTKDPYWDYVTLLMQFDGTNGATAFADESNIGKMPTLGGTPYIDNTTTRSGTVGSARFTSGSSSYVSFPHSSAFVVGSGDFTIECFLRPNATGSQFISTHHNYGSLAAHYFALDSSNKVYFNAYIGNVPTAVTSTTSLAVGTFYHIAVVRSGSTLRLFINGTQESSNTISGTLDNPGTPWNIGRQSNGSLYLDGWISDYRAYVGFAKYTANFTPPSAGIGLGSGKDPYWAYCVLACPFENSLKDMSGRRCPSSGNAQLSTGTKKFGTAALYSDQSSGSNYVSIPAGTGNDFGTNDFTIEGWILLTSTGTGDYGTLIRSSDYYGSSSGNWTFRLCPSSVQFTSFDGTSNQEDVNINFTPSLNTWYHLAAVRKGNTISIFVNGTLIGSAATTKALGDSTNTLVIGQVSNGSYRACYIDSVRITKGYARYSATFSAPTASFPIGKDESADPFWGYNVLAMHMDTFVDATSRHTLASNTAVTTNTTTCKFGTGSASLNGSSSVATIDANSDFDFSIDDFTIEMWVYPTSTTAGFTLSNVRNQAANSDRGSVGFLIGGNAEANVRSGDDSTWFYLNSTSSGAKTPLNSWSHIAFTRRGSVLRLFTNGILTATYTYSSPLSGALPIAIGRQYSSSVGTTSYYAGYIDDLRITKGVARYVHNFTPPILAFA